MSIEIAAYIRVSSQQQDFSSQKAAIVQAARARGEKITRFFEEKRSGKTSSKDGRPALHELFEAVRRGEFRKVYVFRVDRLSRGGIRDTMATVDRLRAHGCSVATISDGFDLDGPAGDVVLAVMAWAAQMERAALGERISAARSRIERAGGRWGRPRRIDPKTLEVARKMRLQGKTVREVSAALKIPKSTLQGALAEKGHYARKRGGRRISTVARETE